MRRALVTGGAGFVGSHLSEALLEQGFTVQVIDDLSTGSMANVDPFRGSDRYSYVLDSMLNRPLLLELVDRADVVFHLAAAVGVQLIVEQPVRTIETNIQCTALVLEMCARKKTPLLLTSTSEVYGKLGDERFHEESDLVLGSTSRPRWCYACSKIIDEFLAKAYCHEKGLPVVVTRLFNTIGPRQTGQYGMVVPRFVQRALRGQPITVYGDGLQQRSFTWVDDVVGALIRLIDHPDAIGQVVNVGHTKEISILDLAKLVKTLTGSDSEIVFVPYEEAYDEGFEDMPRRLPDLTRIRDLIGYEPSIDLTEMLNRIIACHRAELAPR